MTKRLKNRIRRVADHSRACKQLTLEDLPHLTRIDCGLQINCHNGTSDQPPGEVRQAPDSPGAGKKNGMKYRDPLRQI